MNDPVTAPEIPETPEAGTPATLAEWMTSLAEVLAAGGSEPTELEQLQGVAQSWPDPDERDAMERLIESVRGVIGP